MNLARSEEQILLRESARRLLGNRYDYAARGAVSRSDLGFDRDLWVQMADLGWLAVGLPEAVGGLGDDIADVGVVAEALGEFIALEPFTACCVIGAGLLADLGADRHAGDLAGAIEGRRFIVLARDAESASAVARRDGTNWTLTGSYTLVDAGMAADLLLAVALVDGDVAIFAVPVELEGVVRKTAVLTDGSRAADIVLSDVILGVDACLSVGANAENALEKAIARGLVADAFALHGGLQRVLSETRRHVDTRVQFGRPLSALQSVRHTLAHMAVAAAECRGSALLAATALGLPIAEQRRALASAKASAGRSARVVTTAAVQLHGGMGVTEELDIGGYLKRALVFDLSHRAAEWHEADLADQARTRPDDFTQASVCRAEAAARPEQAAA